MTQSPDTSERSLPPVPANHVPANHVAVDDLDWSPGVSVLTEDDLLEELRGWSRTLAVKLELRQYSGPASGLPTVRLSGPPANVLVALLAYNGGLPEPGTSSWPAGSTVAASSILDTLRTFAEVYDFDAALAHPLPTPTPTPTPNPDQGDYS